MHLMYIYLLSLQANVFISSLGLAMPGADVNSPPHSCTKETFHCSTEV